MTSPTPQTRTGSVAILNQATIFVGLLGLSFLIPAIIHQQAVTGPIINAILLFAGQFLNPSSAMLIGMLPSTVALSRGLLPLPLAPMVPFIIMANSLYIYIFSRVMSRDLKWATRFPVKFGAAVVLASLAKFGLLYSSSNLVLNQLLPTKLVPQVSQMMSWPQLATALVGGLIAWIGLKVINHR
ncbi:MAG: hypothetical protein GF381_01975 [Candidatus Pacebacteria bacterium]|nr:hypothetical protein [Candidatus Paceibacterota bacterium]